MCQLDEEETLILTNKLTHIISTSSDWEDKAVSELFRMHDVEHPLVAEQLEEADTAASEQQGIFIDSEDEESEDVEAIWRAYGMQLCSLSNVVLMNCRSNSKVVREARGNKGRNLVGLRRRMLAAIHCFRFCFWLVR